LAVVLVVGTSGCRAVAEPTTTVAPHDVAFGEGELPATLPEGFPLPPGSVVGSTLVTATGLTEVLVRVDGTPDDVAGSLDASLDDAGFTVRSVVVDGDGWFIEFSDDSARGTIEIMALTPVVSQIVISYNLP